MCFILISEQTATSAPYNRNWLVFITEMKSVYFAVPAGSVKAFCASSLKGECDICGVQTVTGTGFSLIISAFRSQYRSKNVSYSSLTTTLSRRTGGGSLEALKTGLSDVGSNGQTSTLTFSFFNPLAYYFL